MTAGERSWRSRLAIGLLTLAVTLAAGITIGVIGADLSGGVVGGGDVSPGPILVSADQRTLAGSVGGSCMTGYLVVDETDREVSVKLRRAPVIMMAPGSCGILSFVAHLREPLGKRRLVDAITGKALPAFDGSGILRPAHLPDGFIHRYDTAIIDDDDVHGGGAGCVQVYTLGAGYEESIWITQQVGAVWTPPDAVPGQRVTVRGRPGLAVPGELTWTENGQLFTIQSHAYPYATLGVDELVRIGDGLA